MSTELVFSISVDDQLQALIEPNIYYTSEAKSLDNVIKMFTFLASGKPRTVACKLTGIPINTVNKWAREEWYQDVIDLIKARLDYELDSTMTAVIHKGASEALDRLENGDVVLDRDGNQVRKPVSGKDAIMIAAIAYDKRALGRGKPTSISESLTTDDRLNKLKERFKEISGEVIENEAVEESQ